MYSEQMDKMGVVIQRLRIFTFHDKFYIKCQQWQKGVQEMFFWTNNNSKLLIIGAVENSPGPLRMREVF
jgi:hypothetical protein